MKYIIVIDLDDVPVIVPIDNIAYVARYESITRIYLQHVAGAGDQLWYVLTKPSVLDVASLIDNEARG